MANLAFRSILAGGSRDLGEGAGPRGNDRFDLQFRTFGLSEFVDLPALLVLATKKVNLEWNFITINAVPDGWVDAIESSFEDASDEDWYLGRILPNPSDTWILQVHRVPSGKLKAANNVLGIHSRNKNGEPAGNRDNFSVARVFLVYFGSL